MRRRAVAEDSVGEELKELMLLVQPQTSPSRCSPFGRSSVRFVTPEKFVPLANSTMMAIVDAESYNEAMEYRWVLDQKGYVYTTKNRLRMFMTDLILPRKEGLYRDHIDGNKLNHKKRNLRYCTHQQNCANRKAYSGNSCGLKGVTRITRGGWQANIRVEGKCKYLGCFSTKELAARAYDRAAVKYFGKFAALNYPNEWHRDSDGDWMPNSGTIPVPNVLEQYS